MNTHFNNREVHPKIRVQMLRAMDTIARSVSNENYIHSWLSCGIADGDADLDDDALFSMYGDDETFADVMACFCRVMEYMTNDAAIPLSDRIRGNDMLFCDWITSKKKENTVKKEMILTQEEAHTTISGLYDAIANKLGIKAERYDCTKVKVGSDILDECKKYYTEQGISSDNFSMAWIQYGPKASLAGFDFEVDEGWYT